ncbi:murein transglycosylase [Diaporthe helianthi]|uniref:Murein transglycosylase n=1 Tax=Diaporthe helianthi TaxID=158607 RepID=A0A2P5HEW9_DIAHE|nr:murein transglycosylase [Diaporthe helianthi]
MASCILISGLLATASLVLPAAAQLSGRVGPTTSTSAKQSKICNIMDYGGKADASADNGNAIAAAWKDCAPGGEVLIPEGDYGMATWVKLSGGKGTSINLEGTIYRTGQDSGNMFMIEHSTDFEFYSATSKGAIQGYGYEFHKEGKYGARLLRLYDVHDFSVHDVILVDAPQFHFSIDTCSNGEVYNMIIHGGYQGGLDGIDVWGSNIWIHDIEVSNKDECVTVKDPSNHLLIEQVHCNWSGGCAMGSLATKVDIHDIEYNYIYTHHSNQMYMIKSNGGSGNVENLAFNNFMGHSNAYTLDFDTAWGSMGVEPGDGINYSNISFSGWSGTCADGTERGPIKMNCPAAVPCTDITVDDFSVWTNSGDEVVYACQNAYGRGACLNPANTTTTRPCSSTQTVTTPAGGAPYPTMVNELPTGWNISSSIPIPTMPASFYPGRQPINAILNGGGSSADTKGKPVAQANVTAAAAAPTGYVGASGNIPSVPSATGFVTRQSAAAPQPTNYGQDDEGWGQGWGQGWGSYGGGWRRT